MFAEDWLPEFKSQNPQYKEATLNTPAAMHPRFSACLSPISIHCLLLPCLYSLPSLVVRSEANAGVLPGPVAVYYFIYQMEECMNNCMNKFWVATSVLGDIAEVLARVSFCSSVKKRKRKTVLSQHLEASWLEHSVF